MTARLSPQTEALIARFAPLGEGDGHQGRRRMRVLSLGMGVQSTTMALLAAHGVIDMPDVALFADTGWEPASVYAQLAWLRSHNVLPYPVEVVSAGNLRDGILARRNTTAGRYAVVPWYGKMPDGSSIMGRRQCTSEYKLAPLMRGIRRLLGVNPRARIQPGTVEVMIGISTDEASRMRPARQKWMRNRWPLIELGMSRRECLNWMARHDYPIPKKSACIGCPYHSDAHWRDMRDNDPKSWAAAVEVDAALRKNDARGIFAVEYMHRSLVPLDQVDLSTAEDHGQIDAFKNDCDGMCGV